MLRRGQQNLLEKMAQIPHLNLGKQGRVVEMKTSHFSTHYPPFHPQINSPRRSRRLLFQSRVEGQLGERPDNKITWYKSVSPPARKIVLRFVSPPRTLTRSMIKEQQRQKNVVSSSETPNMLFTTPLKNQPPKNNLIQSASTNLNDSQYQDRKFSLNPENTFGNSLSYVKE